MLEYLGIFLINAGIIVIVLSVIRITGIHEMTDTILALLFLLIIAVIALDVLPLTDALTSFIQDLPLIGMILDFGSLYEAVQSGKLLAACHEIIKLSNMIVLVDLIGSILDFGHQKKITIRILRIVLTSVAANILMRILLLYVFRPLASSYFSAFGSILPVSSELEITYLSSIFMLWGFFLAPLVVRFFTHNLFSSFSPATSFRATAKALLYFCLILSFEYTSGNTVLQILHGISLFLNQHGGLGFLLVIVFSLFCLIMV